MRGEFVLVRALHRLPSLGLSQWLREKLTCVDSTGHNLICLESFRKWFLV